MSLKSRQQRLTKFVKDALDLYGGGNDYNATAKRLGLKTPAFRKWEKGVTQPDPFKMSAENCFIPLAKAFGKTPGQILDEFYEADRADREDAPPEQKKTTLDDDIARVILDLLKIKANYGASMPSAPSPSAMRIAVFLQELMAKSKMNWQDARDRRAFAETCGKIGTYDCPWEEEDLVPGGLLEQLISGTKEELEEDDYIWLCLSCRPLLKNSDFSSDDLVRVANGKASLKDWLKNGAENFC